MAYQGEGKKKPTAVGMWRVVSWSILTSEKRMPRDKQHPSSYARKAKHSSSPEEWTPSAYQGVVIVTRALAQFTLAMIRVATRPPAHLSWSACGQLSQVGQKRSGGSVHPSSMDLVTYVGLDSLPYLFRVLQRPCPMLFVCEGSPFGWYGPPASSYFGTRPGPPGQTDPSTVLR
jgi:hypothetical protein